MPGCLNISLIFRVAAQRQVRGCDQSTTGWLSGDMQCRQGCSAFELNWSKELTHVEDGIGTKTVMLDLGRLAQTNAQIEQFR
jgi:hypothetical protein